MWCGLKLETRPEPCLRQKSDYQEYHSDLALFKSLPLGDPWEDAHLPQVYDYLIRNKRLVVPTAWRDEIKNFTCQLRAATC